MRKIYIDNIRWITVVTVVVYHVIYMFNGVTQYGVIGPFCENQPQDIFMYIVYPWFMLLLFVVSGMSARLELDKIPVKEFVKKRTRKLLVPSTIGLIVYGWIPGYYNMAIGGGFSQMQSVPKPVLYLIMCVSGTGPLWYIQMLWLFSMLLLLIRKVEKDRLWNIYKKAGVCVSVALVILIYASAQILNTPVVNVYRFGIYLAGFLIGYFVFSHDEVMDSIGKKWVILSTLGAISCVAFVVMYHGQSYVDDKVLRSIVCNAFAWFATLGILAFMKKHGNFENGFTGWMKKCSFGLYVFHYLPIAACAWYIKLYASDMAPALVYIIVTIAGFAGAFYDM